MKLPLFIIILVVETVLSKKAIWDGKNGKKETYIAFETNNRKYITLFSKKFLLKDYLYRPIDVLDHVTLINVPIVTVEPYDDIPENFHVFYIAADSDDLHQTFFSTYFSKKEIVSYEQSPCHLVVCNLGLYLYHRKYKGDEIIKYKVTDFDFVVYIKMKHKDNEYFFDTLKLDDTYIPLILCPYDNWVSRSSMVKYISYERSGIVLENFSKRHIFLPVHRKPFYRGNFFCGYLKFLDGYELKIGFGIRYVDEGGYIKKIDVTMNDLVCSDGMKEIDYYHFVFYNNFKENNHMKYINMTSLDKIPLFHENEIYLYAKSDNIFKDSLKYGFEKVDFGKPHEYRYPRIEPSCKLEINPIPGKFALRRSDNKEINLNVNSSSDVKILYLQEDLLVEWIGIECVIEGEGEESKYNLKNFYNNTFKAELVSIDEKGNVKTVSQINFGESYGKYGCILKPRSGDKLHKDSKFIKPLYFETIYDKNYVSKREWEDANEMSIECINKLEIKLIDMKVVINGKYIYQMSKKDKKQFFFVEDEYVKFKYYEIEEIKNGIKNVKYECFYKTNNNVEFSMKYNGTILDKTAEEDDKKDSSKYENYEETSFQYGDN
uniref:6-cysteine protein n=1 Tax=Parastrongyloides trichosuri TaxID=131310 RepID=A0A0N4Z1L7_PARTI